MTKEDPKSYDVIKDGEAFQFCPSHICTVLGPRLFWISWTVFHQTGAELHEFHLCTGVVLTSRRGAPMRQRLSEGWPCLVQCPLSLTLVRAIKGKGLPFRPAGIKSAALRFPGATRPSSASARRIISKINGKDQTVAASVLLRRVSTTMIPQSLPGPPQLRSKTRLVSIGLADQSWAATSLQVCLRGSLCKRSMNVASCSGRQPLRRPVSLKRRCAFSKTFPKQVLTVGVLAALVMGRGFWAWVPHGSPPLNFCVQAAELVRVTSLLSTRKGRPRKFLL